MDEKWLKEKREFWKDIIYKDGKINEEQVMLELLDYSYILEQLPKVYCHITGGKLSKPFYDAQTITQEADEYYDEIHREYYNEN